MMIGEVWPFVYVGAFVVTAPLLSSPVVLPRSSSPAPPRLRDAAGSGRLLAQDAAGAGR